MSAPESVESRLARLEEMLKQFLARLDERCSTRASDIDDLHRRLVVIEAAEQRRKGSVATLTIFSGIIGATITAVVRALWK